MLKLKDLEMILAINFEITGLEEEEKEEEVTKSGS